MLTAGPLSTSDDSPVIAIADTSPLGPRRHGRHVEIINAGTAGGGGSGGGGFYSFDDGSNWAYLPPGTAVVKDDVVIGNTVRIKRVAGGVNLTDVYVSLW